MTGITPSDEQAKAIRSIVKWYGERGNPEFYLAGYAGVGKSTIAKLAIEEIRRKYRISNVNTAAYTGKAASVLRRKGVPDATTIHGLIYTPYLHHETKELMFAISAESPAAKADLIVLDECSMIDDKLAEDLRSFGKKILVMGDPGQLPPVNGEGAFTRNEPDVFLQQIHRQSAESPIIELATLARQGLPLPLSYRRGDVEVMPLTKESQALAYRDSTQAICGLNKVRWKYTQAMREIKGFNGPHPMPGERIICCRNNKKVGIFNGGMGVLKSRGYARVEGHEVLSLMVDLEDTQPIAKALLTDPSSFREHFTGEKLKRIHTKHGLLNDFDWAYIITCHKAQGSSWDHVTVIDDSRFFRESRYHWLYTALTRSERGLTLLTRD